MEVVSRRMNERIEAAKMEREEMEIDLLEIARLLWHKAWVILLCLIIGAGVFGAYTKFLVTPKYTASSMIYILGETTSITSVADIQLGTQLTGDFTTLAKSRPVLEEVIEKEDLDMSYGELSAAVTIENLPDTHILKISATDPDAEQAKKISNAMAEATAEMIANVMATERPSIAEKALKPSAPSSPNFMKNLLMGGLIGAAFAMAVIIIRHLLDDTIKTEEDVRKYLKLNTLASIPMEKKLKHKGKAA